MPILVSKFVIPNLSNDNKGKNVKGNNNYCKQILRPERLILDPIVSNEAYCSRMRTAKKFQKNVLRSLRLNSVFNRKWFGFSKI